MLLHRSDETNSGSAEFTRASPPTIVFQVDVRCTTGYPNDHWLALRFSC
jgi:hypothetical protein